VTRKISLGEVPANRRRGGDLRVLLSPKTVESTTGFLGGVTLMPGDVVTEHYHPYSEEYLYVVRGTLVLTLDGEAVELGADEAVLVPKNVRHRLTNPGREPAFAVFHLCPLAPRPELGHVDTEEPARPAEENAAVGGPAAPLVTEHR
jgi:putative monooxygenase